MDKILFWKDEEEPFNTGWYICSFDEGEDTPYDTVGPFDSEEDARATQEKYPNG
jgi:hypothetical protein